MINNWKKQLGELSGNLTTNEYMPEKICKELLKEDLSLKNKLSFEEIDFPNQAGISGKVKGFNILSGLQRIHKKGCLTLYRAVRFPTYKRIYEMVSSFGCSIANYEQERILELYHDKKYQTKRSEIRKNKNFWIIPQEKVVPGLPMFSSVNDALQIHRAYRSKKDKVAMIAVHIPFELIGKKIKLISNPAIDLEYDECERDYKIIDFAKKNGLIDFDYTALRAKGIDLHELYAQNLPWCLKDSNKLGIMQDFFVLDIYEIQANDRKKIKDLFQNSKLLKENQYFLHGFFGDQNIFARRKSRYLPFRCQKVSIK
jgi:hypothetical protein